MVTGIEVAQARLFIFGDKYSSKDKLILNIIDGLSICNYDLELMMVEFLRSTVIIKLKYQSIIVQTVLHMKSHIN